MFLPDQFLGELVQDLSNALYYHADRLLREIGFVLIQFGVGLLAGQLGELHHLADAVYYYFE